MMRLSHGFIVAVHVISPERLAELVDSFAPARPVPLDELVQRSKAGKSTAGLLAITVDDGVGDNVRALSRLFRARAWPATHFLATRYLDTGEPMAFQLWNRLKPLLPRTRFELSSGPVDLSSPRAYGEMCRKMDWMWHQQRTEACLAQTLELARVVVRNSAIPEADLRGPDPITWPEVAQLSRDGLIRFESHGVTHEAMSVLSEAELEFEMLRSRQRLEEHTGRPCRHLCYPFGSPLAIGAAAPRLARRLYDSAVTMSLGSVDRADPWLLPRIPFYPENTLSFARLKVLLKCTAVHWPWGGHKSGQPEFDHQKEKPDDAHARHPAPSS